MKKVLASLFALPFLASCAEQSAYQAYTDQGRLPGFGYEDMNVGRGLFLVSYHGGQNDDKNTVLSNLKRRADELGTKHCNGKYSISESITDEALFGRGPVVYSKHQISTAVVRCDDHEPSAVDVQWPQIEGILN